MAAALVCGPGAPAIDPAGAQPAIDPADARPAGPPDDHAISLPHRDAATVGDTRALSLVIAPRPGHAISRDGPLIIDLRVAPAHGLTLPRRRYLHQHAADPRAATLRYDLTYHADRAGRYTVTAHVRLWVCGKRTCRPARATHRVHITVSEPAARSDGRLEESPVRGPPVWRSVRRKPSPASARLHSPP